MPQPTPSHRPLVLPALVLTLLGLLLFAACSGDDDPVTPPPGGGDPDISGTLGTAGGTLTSGDGTVSFTLPPGAVATDTEITIEELQGAEVPDLGPAMIPLRSFSMEPAGLALSTPGTLTFPVDLPGAKGQQAREVPVGLSVLSGEFLEEIPPNNVIEQMTLRVDHQNNASEAVLTVRGFSSTNTLVVLQALQPTDADPAIAGILQHIDSAKEGESIDLKVQYLISDGLGAPVPLAYIDHGNTGGIAMNLDDGEALSPSTEGVVPDGYLQAYDLPAVAQETGSYSLKAAFSMEISVDFATLYGEEYAAPRIDGATRIEHRFADLAVDVEPAGGGGLLDNGVYPVMTQLEGITILRAPGYRYDGDAAVSGGNGTILYNLKSDNPFAIRSNAFQIPGVPAYGSFIVGDGYDQEPSAGLTFVKYSPSGILLNKYDTEINDHAWSQLGFNGENVTDGQPFRGEVGSGGFILANNTRNLASVFNYNTGTGFFDQEGQINQFENATGSVVTAGVMPDGGALVVTDGLPGRLYFHDRINYGLAASYVGDVGDSPRRFRSWGDFGTISNFGSNSLSLVAKLDFKNGGYSVVGAVPVGDGPVGIDLMGLDGGNIAIASTGFNDDTYSVTVVTPAGEVVANDKMNLPAGAEGPGHVVWLGDPAMRLLVTCNTTGNVAVVDSGLK